MRKWIWRLGYLAICALLGAIALEVGATWIYQHYRGRQFSRSEILGRLLDDRVGANPVEELSRDVIEEIAEIKTGAIPDAPVVLHPFFGFVANPQSPGINGYGFFQESPLVEYSPDIVTVAIFGGSLADQIFYMAQDRIVQRLEQSDVFGGKRVRVVSTALGGYKQPQQLNILTFMLARGADYDIVVNIDGFNEIDCSIGNFYDGINPFFPHNWKLHARRGLNPQAMKHLGKMELIRQRRQRLRERFSHLPLRSSAFMLTLWDMLDGSELNALRNETRQLGDLLAADELPPRVAGPPHPYQKEDDLYGDLARVWARASLAMDTVCERFGCEYFHFLQPNQYVPNSKPLTEEEQRVAYVEDFVGVDYVPRGFAMLSHRGEGLRQNGVHFVDLTKMFRAENRTVYSDFCCHVNQLGAELIANRIAAEVIDANG